MSDPPVHRIPDPHWRPPTPLEGYRFRYLHISPEQARDDPLTKPLSLVALQADRESLTAGKPKAPVEKSREPDRPSVRFLLLASGVIAIGWFIVPVVTERNKTSAPDIVETEPKVDDGTPRPLISNHPEEQTIVPVPRPRPEPPRRRHRGRRGGMDIGIDRKQTTVR